MSTPLFSDLWKDSPTRGRAETIVRNIQDRICSGVLALEGAGSKFHEDVWHREDRSEGGGITRVLQDGKVFEKAGVNVSVISSTLSRAGARAMKSDHAALERVLARPDSEPIKFFATGVSVVIHGHNPFVPTMHCNYRYFEICGNGNEPDIWWVGGGTDLTPAYVFDEDCRHFHQVQKDALDRIDESFYPRFKAWCDTYFYNAHRQEGRGIGGIFFDDIDSLPLDQAFELLRTCGSAVNDAYFPIVERRMNSSFTEEQKHWQQLRRGRYVEFNLIWDRGTKFGLHTPNARIESILMSLPLTSRWEYMYEPKAGSEEDKLVRILKEPKEWLS